MTERRVCLEAQWKNPIGKVQLTMEERSCADGEREVPEETEGNGVWTAESASSGQGRKEEAGGKEGWEYGDSRLSESFL